MRAGEAEYLGDESVQRGRVLQDLLGEGWPVAPLGLLGVVIESGDPGAIRADVELELQFKGILIPSGITRASGIAQDRAGLSELLEGIQGCGMLERGQGTGK